MNTLYSTDNLIVEVHEEYSKISLEQCYSCKRVYNYKDTNCFLTYCSWCGDKVICDRCCSEVFYNEEESCREGFCSDGCYIEFLITSIM